MLKINLAAEEDKAWEIDYWARLFKATTWEEIKMIAKQNAEITRQNAIIEQLQKQIAEKQ